MDNLVAVSWQNLHVMLVNVELYSKILYQVLGACIFFG